MSSIHENADEQARALEYLRSFLVDVSLKQRVLCTA
jgi:hypothetical protein